jgi:hypothetical protein
MYLNEYAEAQRLLRVTQRAKADRKIRPRLTVVGQETTVEAEIVEEERRIVPRGQVSGDIIVRRVGSFPFSVRVANVSIGGCGIELVDGYEVDDSLVARFPQLEPLGGRVCWTKGHRAGMEFSKMIHPAVLHALLGRMTEVSASA